MSGWGAAALLVSLLLVVVWQIVVRHAPMSIPSVYARWTEELARVLMLWLTSVGAAYAGGRRAHLAIDLLTPRLSAAAARTLDTVGQGLVAVFGVVVMAAGGGVLAFFTFRLEQFAASLDVPMGAVYAALPIGGALLACYAVCNVIEGRPAAGGDGGAP